MNALCSKQSKAQITFTASIWLQPHMHNGRFIGKKKKRINRFPRKGNCVGRTLMSKSSNASQRKKKKSNLEHHLFGAFPKQQFDKRASASLLSANLISLLHYTVLKIKNRSTHLLKL